MNAKIKYQFLGVIIVGTIGAVFGFIINGGKGAMVGVFFGAITGEIFGIALSSNSSE